MKKLIAQSHDCRCYVPSGFVLAMALLLLITTHSLAANAEEVPLYGLYEITIDYMTLSGHSHSYSDPFYGVELEATFVSPSGRQTTWWGFYDGDGLGAQNGDIWKLRFMPNELGAWSFTWQFSDGSLSGSNSFQCVDNATYPAKDGPLRHDPDLPQWFITADGYRHVFLNMYGDDTDSPNIKSAHNQYLNPQKHIDKCKDNGFDVIFTNGSIHPTNRDRMPMDENNPFPYVDTNSYIPRLQGWHHMEGGLWQKCYEQSIYVYEFWGFYGGNRFYDLNLKNISFQNKVIKYWLTRTAPYYIFLYNIGFELPEYVSVPSWSVDRAKFIKSIDPWNHPITGHELHGWSYANSVEIDYSTLQNNDNFHQRALTVWNSPSKPHPHCNECIWNAQWQVPGTEASHRKDLWDGITAGMSYAFYAIDSEIGLTSFRHANAFLKSGVKWWTMSPYDEVVFAGTAYVLAKPGTEYIVYSSSGSSFTLNLPAGDYQRRWFNPVDGTYSDWASFNTLGGSVEFVKPDTNDWVLHINTEPYDLTGPTIPQGLSTSAASESRIDLAWQAASDPESGISGYKVYRNGAFLRQSSTTSFSDTGLAANTSYAYEVSAVNGAGLESEKSAPISAKTLADTRTLVDTIAPTIISGTTSGDPNKVTVVFSEPVEEASSEDISNYGIDNDVTISGASLASDLNTVVLITSPHTDVVTYTLNVNNIRDRASTPNVIAAKTQVTYTFADDLVISNLTVDSGKPYEVIEDGLQNGSLAYIDRGYTFKDVPASLLGAAYIKTANADKGLTGDSFITFEVNQDVTVYVAHDNRIATKPSWMESFTDTGDDLVTTDTTLSIFAKHISAGTVTIGGNEGGYSMYIAIIVAQGNPSLSAPTRLRIGSPE